MATSILRMYLRIDAEVVFLAVVKTKEKSGGVVNHGGGVLREDVQERIVAIFV